MSISSEISRINQNIASAYSACNNKGATMPQTQNSANLATAISSISTGITPSGSVNITANGTYDVTDKASAVVAIPAFSVTNLVPSSKESDGTPYNGGTGYKTGYRLSTSVGSPSEEKAHSSYAITGFIPVVRNDVIRVMKCGFSPAAYAIGIWIFDSNQNLLNALQFVSQTAAASYRLQDQVWNVLLNGSNSTTSDSVAYVRIVFNATMAGNLIVTKNEKISPLEV